MLSHPITANELMDLLPWHRQIVNSVWFELEENRSVFTDGQIDATVIINSKDLRALDDI
ncbi:MAG: hypothetical protein JKY34_00325 [Kordiimonadaceae bacterium]|nr:hypothetical protein [Kordiimonadaceae bacterium]